MLRNYTRWRQGAGDQLHADILNADVAITVDTAEGRVLLNDTQMSPDEARLIGVRLIDAAVLADGSRAIRRQSAGT